MIVKRLRKVMRLNVWVGFELSASLGSVKSTREAFCADFCKHGGRKGGREDKPPPGFWNLTFSHEIFSKKGCFRSFKWLKWNFALLAPYKNISDYSWIIHYWSLLGKQTADAQSPMFASSMSNFGCVHINHSDSFLWWTAWRYLQMVSASLLVRVK